jgi:hypothetical protein
LQTPQVDREAVNCFAGNVWPYRFLQRSGLCGVEEINQLSLILYKTRDEGALGTSRKIKTNFAFYRANTHQTNQRTIPCH